MQLIAPGAECWTVAICSGMCSLTNSRFSACIQWLCRARAHDHVRPLRLVFENELKNDTIQTGTREKNGKHAKPYMFRRPSQGVTSPQSCRANRLANRPSSTGQSHYLYSSSSQ
eukprot:6188117-Pleurochrysis_carterae.AAC.2